jgi:Restriction endonuclease
MTPFFLALVATVLLLLLIALFSRGGAGETLSGRRVLEGRRGGDLVDATRQVLSAMGYRVGPPEPTPQGRVDLVAEDPRPLAGQRLYIRVFPETSGPVGVAEVQAALDRIKEGFHKAVLISSAGFSNEGIAAARDTAVELIEAAQLDEVSSQLSSRRPGERAGARGAMTQGDVPA